MVNKPYTAVSSHCNQASAGSGMPAKTRLENPAGMGIVAPDAPEGAGVTGVGTGMRMVCRTAVLAVVLGLPAAATAEGLNLTGSTKSRAAIFDAQAELIDKKLKKQYSGSVKLTPKGKKKQDDLASGGIPAYRGSYKGEYLEVAKTVARKHGVPEDLFLRLVQQESGWNPVAVSTKGATGLAQLMPDTAAHLGVDINDAEDNLDGGARYLRMMYDKFGTWELALAAYNAGPGAVEEHKGIPPFAETENYVKAILG
jgi:soluble lytic murein transglycosylase-like protein